MHNKPSIKFFVRDKPRGDHPSKEEQSIALALTLIADLCCFLSSRLGIEREVDRDIESARDFTNTFFPQI